MKARVRRLLGQRLSTQVVIMMVAILVVTMAAGFAVVQWNLNRQLDEQYEQRALAVAQSLASQPGLQQAVSAGDPGGVGPHGMVQNMAMAAMNSTAAAFVVVTDRQGIRLSHRNPRLIGTPIGYPDRRAALERAVPHWPAVDGHPARHPRRGGDRQGPALQPAAS